jgi:3-deoxy-D-manno-octulosonic-acid transferase
LRTLYLISIYGLNALISIAALFNSKAKRWKMGRVNWFEELKTNLLHKTSKRLWVHCSSLGEFEMARPFMEKWKKDHPNWNLVITFFSPSGYDVQKEYALAEWVGYLPLDTPENAGQFYNVVNPDMVVFVKYEFWYYLLNEAVERKIPVHVISATFRPEHFIFKNHGKLIRNLLKKLNTIFVQNQRSKDLLESYDFQNVIQTGDNRFDRVKSIAARTKEKQDILQWKGDHLTLVLGSSWPEEENLIKEYLFDNPEFQFKILIAPHDISESHLDSLETLFSEFGVDRFSSTIFHPSNKVILIDTIGHLSSLYSMGDVALVGGGFGRGLHNILEPMAHGLPVLFGSKHSKFPEASDAIEHRCAFEINSQKMFNNRIGQLFNSNELRDEYSNNATQYIESNTGATEKLIKSLSDFT